jgi:hypothetical protein
MYAQSLWNRDLNPMNSPHEAAFFSTSAETVLEVTNSDEGALMERI